EFNGSRVYLPSTMKVKSGDEIIVRGRRFRAKKKSFDKRGPLMMAALGIVIVLGLAFIASRFFVQTQPGMVVGQVINSQSGEVIQEAQVIIDELGETVFTNANGIFVIDNLSDGDWSVSASKPQYKTAAIGFSHGGGKTSVLTLSLEPSIPVKNDEDDKKDEKKIKEVRIPNYGKLTVITNTPKSKIIVDNKMLGPGNKTYSKITVGKHNLVVMAEGYKEYSGHVEIKRNENNKFTIDLQELKAEYKPSEISFEDYLAKADAMASKGDWTEAIGNYTLALAKREDGDTYHKRSTTFLQTGQKNQAIKDLVRASRAYTNQGRVNRSIECLNEILDLEPKNTTAYRERGFANLRLGNFEKAIDDLKEAVDIDDDDFDNHMALGEAYYIMGKHKDALKYLKKARKINDNNARVYALSALASLARDDEGDAEKYFKGFEIRASMNDRKEFERDPDWQKLSDMMSQLDD
ncbi:MAG: tetratricopeptide repeat protein, partial [candidate division Zixibacteria bacterium]|nr:tetratricopeptide repeat protein [candidate division Zixibacteria bacterium]